MHRHSDIGLHGTTSVHYGTLGEIREQRQANLTSAFDSNPMRFRGIAPQAPIILEIVWINPPIKEVLAKYLERPSVTFDLTGSELLLARAW